MKAIKKTYVVPETRCYAIRARKVLMGSDPPMRKYDDKTIDSSEEIL